MKSVSTPPNLQSVAVLAKATMLLDLKERWSEDNRPYHFPHAAAVLMGHVALLESHDAALIHRVTGFPLGFVSDMISALLKSAKWHSDSGYIDLVRLARASNAHEFDAMLGEHITHGTLPDETYSELEMAWYRLMGVHIEL
ncbi:hypothetical protein JAO29_18970 [Edaphobacter sp. HDX4]|uniref:hypothetical protein n=1 Tax=Edaphobacter sp. HDX4 TaxID=2794064 RepID=UPI002FE5D928